MDQRKNPHDTLFKQVFSRVKHAVGLLKHVLLPVVIHHSERGWTRPTAFDALYDVDSDVLAQVREHVPHFRFVLDDISDSSDTELRLRAMTALGRLVLLCFRHSRNTK